MKGHRESLVGRPGTSNLSCGSLRRRNTTCRASKGSDWPNGFALAPEYFRKAFCGGLSAALLVSAPSWLTLHGIMLIKARPK